MRSYSAAFRRSLSGGLGGLRSILAEVKETFFSLHFSHTYSKSPGTRDCILGLDLFSALTSRKACDSSFRQYHGSLIHKSSRQGILNIPIQESSGSLVRGTCWRVSLKAIHLLGQDNITANLLSRWGPRPAEWQLHPAVARTISAQFGKAEWISLPHGKPHIFPCGIQWSAPGNP